MQPTLSFEQAPPISVPFRFFLTAPLFGAVAGLILALLGPETLASRWSRGALAMTHLIVVDFMLQAMCGSLLQFVAVVAGANIWRPSLVAAVVHPLITAGAIFLASAFLFEQPVLFLLAAGVFVAALGLFLTVMGIALLRTPAHSMSIHVLRLAVLGLLVTVVAGATLAVTLGLALTLPPGVSLPALINVHVAWGLGGWALMLVIGVSYLVVPMFQLTPGYPAWFTRLLPAGLLAVLLIWTLQIDSRDEYFRAMAGRRRVSRCNARGCVRARHARAASPPASAPDRCHLHAVARRDALARRAGRVLDRVCDVPAVGRRITCAGLARHPGPAGTVPLGHHRHAVQDHALPQLAPPAAGGRHRHGDAQHEADDSGNRRCVAR